MTIGGQLGAAAGPIGVGGAVNTALSTKPAPMFTYSKSKGLFAGVSLEGTVLIERVSFGASSATSSKQLMLSRSSRINRKTPTRLSTVRLSLLSTFSGRLRPLS